MATAGTALAATSAGDQYGRAGWWMEAWCGRVPSGVATLLLLLLLLLRPAPSVTSPSVTSSQQHRARLRPASQRERERERERERNCWTSEEDGGMLMSGRSL